MWFNELVHNQHAPVQTSRAGFHENARNVSGRHSSDESVIPYTINSHTRISLKDRSSNKVFQTEGEYKCPVLEKYCGFGPLKHVNLFL